MSHLILCGDALEGLAALPDESVHCCVTSPPYWGLRDYGVSGQLGLEPTPEEYVTRVVEIFREVRRVLRADGTLWLNLGDSYAGNASTGGTGKETAYTGKRVLGTKTGDGLKPKDLVGIPWRVAFALQSDGWVLRSDVCWSKPNPMPESVRDRPTKSHEYVFLLAKAKRVGPGPRRFDHLSDEDARWLALFVDTEGSIVLRREKSVGGRRERHAAQVSIGGTCRALVESARDIVGHGNILERNGTNAPMYYWQVSNGLAADLLHRVYPFLIVKRQQAKCCIHIEDRKNPSSTGLSDAEVARRDELWRTVKSLNQFGSPDVSWVPEPKYGRWDSQPYYYDAEAVRERDKGTDHVRNETPALDRGQPGVSPHRGLRKAEGRNGAGRNMRSVWTIPTRPFPEAHFATFPPELPRRCIMAGTSELGCCRECGAPWERVIDVTYGKSPVHGEGSSIGKDGCPHGMTGMPRLARHAATTGWRPTCGHDAGAVACTVLDPFAGSGTTGMVALQLGRHFVGIELSYPYSLMARARVGAASISTVTERGGKMAPIMGPLFDP